MNGTIPLVNGYRMAWRPAVVSGRQRTSLGQRSFIESPIVALGTDALVMVTSAYIGYGLSLAQKSAVAKAAAKGQVTTIAASGWGTLWYVIAAAAAMKLLHDISRI
jgi:predicted transcriptional regulator